MTTLTHGEREQHRIGNYDVTFSGSGSPEFHITDGQLLLALQRGDDIAAGTRVRISHYDGRGTWFEVWCVVDVEARRAA